MIDIKIEEIVELKEQGMSDRKIAEYFTSQGRSISLSNVNTRLNKYYRSIGKEKQRAKEISDEELYELKEQGLSDKEIAEHFTSQGRNISLSNVNLRLSKYYKLIEKEKPRAKESKHRKSMTGISNEELYELKEQGLSDRAIAKHFTSQGRNISVARVNIRLNKYYKLIGETKPKSIIIIKITNEELYKLKEQGLSDQEIVEYFANQGKKISREVVNIRLNKYYKSIGKEKPRAKKSKTRKSMIVITDEELYELKEQGLTDQAIAEYFTSQGKKISIATVNIRLNRYYKSIEEEKARAIKLEETEDISKKVSIKENTKYNFDLSKLKDEDNDIMYMLMTGTTIRECGFNEEQTKNIIKRLKKLKIVAEHAKKRGEQWIPDTNFIEVLKYLKDLQIIHPESRYMYSLKKYLNDKKCKHGNIDLIKKNIFNDNDDLMVYILLKLDLDYNKEYDQKVWFAKKEAYEEKIYMYFERLHLIEERLKEKTSETSENNRKHGEER